MLFRSYRDDASKISFILEAPDDARQAPGRQRRAGAVNLGVPGTDKGTAVKRMLAAISGSVADTIAFGDAAVDVPMLRTCAINVAMGSGGEQARMAAAHVTDDVERDGLAKAFAHFGMTGMPSVCGESPPGRSCRRTLKRFPRFIS